MWSMTTTHLIAASVSPEMKARFRVFVEHHQMSESALVKQVVDSAMRDAGEIDADVSKPTGRRLRGSRTSVRLHPDDNVSARVRDVVRELNTGSLDQSGADRLQRTRRDVVRGWLAVCIAVGTLKAWALLASYVFSALPPMYTCRTRGRQFLP